MVVHRCIAKHQIDCRLNLVVNWKTRNDQIRNCVIAAARSSIARDSIGTTRRLSASAYIRASLHFALAVPANALPRRAADPNQTTRSISANFPMWPLWAHAAQSNSSAPTQLAAADSNRMRPPVSAILARTIDRRHPNASLAMQHSEAGSRQSSSKDHAPLLQLFSRTSCLLLSQTSRQNLASHSILCHGFGSKKNCCLLAS
jgi:hypothetical protein